MAEYQCQTCQANGFFQPDNVDICLEVCPTGYTENASSFNCDDSAIIVSYIFDTIAKEWSSSSIKLFAGSDETSEPTIEPWTYYKRGLYFDGARYATWSRTAGERLTLHA